jgi:hypothetical protein
VAARRRTLAVVAALLALLAFGVLRSHLGTRLDSFTVDEPWHAVAGAAYVQHGDFALNPEHPPLVKQWVGRALGDSLKVPPTPPLRDKGDERVFVETLVHRDHNDAAVQSRVRAAMWALHACLLGFIGVLAWRAFGAPWALASVAFLVIEPSVAAYAPVVMTDLAVALTLLAAAIALGLLLSSWRWRDALLLGIALGLALSAKHSALPGLAGLAGFALLGWLVSLRAGLRAALPRLAQLLCAAAVALCLLWAHYHFRFAPRPDGSDGFNRAMADKIGDLHSPRLRGALTIADTYHFLPRAYLWGLADTLRAGIEGRGDIGVLLWGKFRPGPPGPWAWASFIIAKLPLALLVMALLGCLALWRAPLSSSARWALAAVAVMAAAHFAALASAESAFAGFRHATPTAFALAIPAGALAWRAWLARDRRYRLVPIGLLAAALASTIGEPRLWEFHNLLAGGTAGAQQQFDNESLDIGQRLHEVRDFYAREIEPTGATLYMDNWAYQARHLFAAHKLRMQNRVASIHDDNDAGIYDGWFLKNTRARLPAPQSGYDPAEALEGLEPVKRIGNVELWRGRQVRPKARAWGMMWATLRYVYSEGGDDWALVARRAEEILQHMPGMFPASIELGNARLKLGDSSRCAAGLCLRARTEGAMPMPPIVRDQLQRQVERIDANAPAESIAPIRNPWLE